MELELCTQKFPCYREERPQVVTRELNTDTIIPDYCPDISRIIDSSAALYLPKLEYLNGHLKLSGSVEINVLYMPDSGGGVKSFTYSIPVEEALEQEEYAGERLSLSGEIHNAEITVLNPRKLSNRITITLTRKFYTAGECLLCCEIPQQSAYGIQVRKESKTLSYIKSVQEKDFSFEEELSVSSAKEPICEILRTNQYLYVDECKAMGSKLMLKGNIEFCVLYLTESGHTEKLSAQLPFSQILDGCESDGQLSAAATVQILGADYRKTAGDNGAFNGVSVKLSLRAFAVICEKQTVECICDLYSTTHRLNCSVTRQELSALPEWIMHEEELRESIDSGEEIDSVLSSEIFFSQPELLQVGKQVSIRIPYKAKVLYNVAEKGIYCAERSGEVHHSLSLHGEAKATYIRVKHVTSIPHLSGIDFRASFTLVIETCEDVASDVFSQIQAEQEEPNTPRSPSVVLRRKGNAESLWDIAKEYRSTQNDILSANNVSDEAALFSGKMLLIPKKR